jgi:hypothetical protein
VARERRQTERLDFTIDDVAPVVARMARLARAGDGWINLVPKVADNADRQQPIGFFTLFGGGGTGMTMCTWIPGSNDPRRRRGPSLGIAHVAGRRVVTVLGSVGVPVPELWIVEQDHPRRGLVVRIPREEGQASVLDWALRAVGVLSAPRGIRGWRADVYLPITA